MTAVLQYREWSHRPGWVEFAGKRIRVKDAIDCRLQRTFESDLHQQDGSGGVAVRAAVDDELVVLVELLERIRREIGHGSCLRRPQARPLARPAPDVASTARLKVILILWVRSVPASPRCGSPVRRSGLGPRWKCPIA